MLFLHHYAVTDSNTITQTQALMHVHTVLYSPAFSASVVDLIAKHQRGKFVVFVTKSIDDIERIDGSTRTRGNLWQMQRWLRRQAVDTLTIHFLSSTAALLARALPLDTKISWSVWGGDYYDLPRVRKLYSLTGKHTLSLRQRLSYAAINRLLPRITTVIGNACDLTEIASHLDLNATTIQLNHQWDIKYFATLPPPSGDWILLGNSDDVSNNHTYIIDQVVQKLGSDIHCLLPLSGVDTDYTRDIRQYLASRVANSLCFDTFVEADSYFGSLAQCSILVFGHLRQQGMATLFPFLLSGRKCFFHPNNPYFRYLKTLGLQVFSLDELDSTAFFPLSQAQMDENHRLLSKLLAEDLIADQWQKALSKS